MAATKTVVIVTLCGVLFASTAFGQQAPQPHQGGSKAIWTGTGLRAAGLIVMPVTGVGNPEQRAPVDEAFR